MPLVRIDLSSTLLPRAAAVSDAVHQAMVDTFNVPPDDRFQTVTPRPPGELVCTPAFLGVRHGEQVVFVQITCAPGRSLDMKKALYARIAADVARQAAIDPADVVINLVETARENWSFGNGLAQYAL
ncbi:MAG: tautomerase family protein [Ramlibacter sp.]|nr:tautomerase family protein [Ramlibacter sp.]